MPRKYIHDYRLQGKYRYIISMLKQPHWRPFVTQIQLIFINMVHLVRSNSEHSTGKQMNKQILLNMETTELIY